MDGEGAGGVERGKGGERGERGERGAMTVAMLAVTLGMALVLVVALVLAGVVVAEHRARSAADLGSLAAAAAIAGGMAPGPACAQAATVVQRNHATLLACAPAQDGSVALSVASRWPGGLIGLGSQIAGARARAGPSTAGSGSAGGTATPHDLVRNGAVPP